MPQRRCALKRLRVDKTKAKANANRKAELKKELKGLRSLISQGKTDEAKTQLRVVFAKLDRAVCKGLLHKNTAARRKSSLSVMISKAKA
ncbi:MAG: 30S ribosomal protein S20 [Candidatus Omnitrophota bacterium]